MGVRYISTLWVLAGHFQTGDAEHLFIGFYATCVFPLETEASPSECECLALWRKALLPCYFGGQLPHFLDDRLWQMSGDYISCLD